MALVQARRAGIHPFRTTIDETAARDYLPHMYGRASWVLIDDVQRPLKVADVYRRLTS
jgi:nitric oxide reductase NorD protein